MLVSGRACHPPNDSLGGLPHRLGDEQGRLLQDLRVRGRLTLLPVAPEVPWHLGSPRKPRRESNDLTST